MKNSVSDSQDLVVGNNDEPARSRFVVGIDLGTTNCAVCFVDTLTDEDGNPGRNVETFPLNQWVDLGQHEPRETLPSFHYELTSSERDACEFQLPWQQQPQVACVGVMARDAGLRNPGRRTASAKSWLSHDGVDRSADFLPWHGDANVARLSPVTASARYLAHIRDCWDNAHPDHPLQEQDVVITLPASFDEVARDLTVRAARLAGLPRVYLIEEPQAAFYAWIDRQGTQWQQTVTSGQLILVCDIGGGTTDLTLIRVKPAGEGQQQVQFYRVAVGKHLILGGDNLDLAIAKLAEGKMIESGSVTELSSNQWDRLLGVARQVKEVMLGAQRPSSYTISLPAEGSRLVGGAIQVQISAEDLDDVILGGFFPAVSLDAKPVAGASGFQEFGLPYAADPAITRHLAEFLSVHRRTGIDADDSNAADRPDMVLFNGGVMESELLRSRVVDQLSDWFRKSKDDSWQPELLKAPRLDLAVAQGAAYYGLVRRGEGVRIAANLGRSYYMQVQDNPPKAICLVPGSAQPGQRFRAGGAALRLQIGAPVQFPLWVSSTRLSDAAGQLITIEPAEATPLPPICTALKLSRKSVESTIDVFVEAELSEIGTVGLYCVDAESGKRWKLEFDIRSTLETDRSAHAGGGEAAGIVDAETTAHCQQLVESVFANDAESPPAKLIKSIQRETESSRHRWPPSLLREMWRSLSEHETGRRKSAQHEARWLNMAGFCLRPGYGVAVDDWRVAQTWKQIYGKIAFPTAQSRSESLILWRRIAGGLTSGQQQQLASPLISLLKGKSGRIDPNETVEVWRLLGSLERLAATDKVDLGRLAISMLGKPKFAKNRTALLWAIGRIGSRTPVYGPLNATVRPTEVSDWVDRLAKQSLDSDEAIVAAMNLCLVQLARMTGDRSRDLPIDTRTMVADCLSSASASERLINLLTEVGSLQPDDEAAIFGDTLPLGIQLVRSS